MFVTSFALMNFFLYQVTIPRLALLASVPAWKAVALAICYNSPHGQSDSSEMQALIAAIVACWVVFMTAMYLANDWVVQQALPYQNTAAYSQPSPARSHPPPMYRPVTKKIPQVEHYGDKELGNTLNSMRIPILTPRLLPSLF
ncbi:hypothetical protein ABVK25_006890 [Lepraria finkii]|uniref:Uncharacterized protein n=1 Tax=Lepraria finkii TaxID=1340010 RepID=A0ABR4B504_9LECA